MSQYTKLVLTMSSGIVYRVVRVELFRKLDVIELDTLNFEAQKLLTPQTSGIGFIGSLSWVVMMSSLMSWAEDKANSKRKGEGLKLLAAYESGSKKLKQNGVYIDVASINNLDFPEPRKWLGKNAPEKRKIQSSLVHDGSEFVNIETVDGDLLSIRWSFVESIQYIKNREAKE